MICKALSVYTKDLKLFHASCVSCVGIQTQILKMDLLFSLNYIQHIFIVIEFSSRRRVEQD